ncbi:MAG: IS5 family transposase [Moorea sp. SIO2B7]|nr:IS5 family transposase [Moorena sp. SIO2B7]
MFYFRERIDRELVNKINKRIVKCQTENREKEVEESQGEETGEGEKKNKGKLIIDATCSPADISYPTDLELLNKAREQTERIIDKLHKGREGKLKEKPRDYRKKARKQYLEVAKKRKPSQEKIRKGIGKQLKYLNRNISNIKKILSSGANLKQLKKSEQRMYETVQELYRQQLWIFENNKKSIEKRIVSLNQPHVRPIVRVKAGKNVEFGAKIVASCVDGYVFLDHLSWENFNESCLLKEQIEKFKEERGHYPESVHVDKIYRTRENRRWCKEKGIRMSGPPLGRPPAYISKEEKRQANDDERIRNWIEGKFGQAKGRFSLNRVMAKLQNTSETAIAISFLVMNLSTLLRQVFCVYFWQKYFFLGFSLSLIIVELINEKQSLYKFIA